MLYEVMKLNDILCGVFVVVVGNFKGKLFIFFVVDRFTIK